MTDERKHLILDQRPNLLITAVTVVADTHRTKQNFDGCQLGLQVKVDM